jgi:branched-chain amino acid transport system substrate-binding protein
MMAIEEAQAAGWKIEVVTADSKCDAQEASNAANKVISEDKVKYIVGEVCSSASIPISQIANKAKVLQISPTSTNPAVTVNEDGSVKPYTFRACFLDPFQGEVVAALAPRAFFSNSPLGDDNFDVRGVKKAEAKVREVYALLGAADRLQIRYSVGSHDFSADARREAYALIDRILQHTPLRNVP